MSTRPEIQQDVENRNTAIAEEVAKLALLDEKLEALQDAAREKRQALRLAYRDAHAAHFADVDPKRALVGAKCEHAISVAGAVAFFVRPPSAAALHTIDKFIADPVAPDEADQTKSLDLGPVTEAERTMLAWVVGVHLLADPNAKRQELEPLAPARRLKALRGLPDNLLRRVAEECVLLQSWLNVVLEIELGNF